MTKNKALGKPAPEMKQMMDYDKLMDIAEHYHQVLIELKPVLRKIMLTGDMRIAEWAIEQIDISTGAKEVDE